MSFVTDLNNLKTLLAADTGIAALFPGKTVKVRRTYIKRTEINVADLPIIQIVSPRKSTAPEHNAAAIITRTVMLYMGFNCENRETAQDLVIQFEEAVENAVMKDPTLSRTVMDITPGDSANDEGKFHPVYFIAKELHISKEVTWA